MLHPQQPPPTTAEKNLDLQVDFLRELIKESDPGDVEAANRMLQDSLPSEFLDFLPTKLLADPRTAQSLIFNPAPTGSTLADWKEGAEEAVQKPPMSSELVLECLQDLDLPTFLGRLL